MSDVDLFVEAGERIRELRGTFSQAEFAEQLDVDRKTVVRWEGGERLPDGKSLLALATVFGGDVNYILTGERSSSQALKLTAEEQTMLGYFREASKEVRRAALGALLGASLGPGHTSAGPNSQVSSGAGAVNIGAFGNTPPTKRRK